MGEINSSLADELLDTILDKDPKFFESLIGDLLVKMGYGQGKTTQYTGDGGIDGIITTDALGFDPIYTQAKRYAKDHKSANPSYRRSLVRSAMYHETYLSPLQALTQAR